MTDNGVASHPALVAVGDQLPSISYDVDRLALIRYAGASGDFNPLHWSDLAADAAGLPDVIAHGMLTMGSVLRVVTDWAADPAKVLEYSVRFRSPVPVPPIGVVSVTVTAHVVELLTDDTVRVAIAATCDGTDLLQDASAVVSVR